MQSEQIGLLLPVKFGDCWHGGFIVNLPYLFWRWRYLQGFNWENLVGDFLSVGRWLPREELADLNKKLLKRPTSLEDNDHQSLINDYQPEAEKPKTFLVAGVSEFPNYLESSHKHGKFPATWSSQDRKFLNGWRTRAPSRHNCIPRPLHCYLLWASDVPYLEVYSGWLGGFQETDSGPFCALMYGGWVSGKSKNVEIFIGVRRRPT